MGLTEPETPNSQPEQFFLSIGHFHYVPNSPEDGTSYYSHFTDVETEAEIKVATVLYIIRRHGPDYNLSGSNV